MDRVDADILRLLSWNPINPVDARRGPYGLWDIARHLEVHGNTVKRRLKEMEDAGVLLGLALFPNGVDIGVEVHGVKMRFDSFDACRAAEERILDMNRPGGVMRLAGNQLLTNVLVPPGTTLARAMEDARQTLGAQACDLMTPRSWGLAEITDLERRVLMVLVGDPLITPPEVADKVGVTPKTARRCIVSLRDKQAFIVLPLTAYTKATGLIPVNIELEGERGALGAAMMAAPELLMGGTLDARVLSLHGFAESLEEQGRMVEAIRAVPGIKRVEATVIESWHWTGSRPLARAVSEGLAGLEEWVKAE